MNSFIANYFATSLDCCKKRKVLLWVLIGATITLIAVGVFTGIKIDNAILPYMFSNVPYIKYLRGHTGFAGFVFTLLFIVLIFLVVICISCIKKYFIPLGLLFYLYYVYVQTVTIISVSQEFGFFNTIILMIIMTFITVLNFALMILSFMICVDNCDSNRYLSSTFKQLMPMIIAFVAVSVLAVLIMSIFKNFVFILVYN